MFKRYNIDIPVEIVDFSIKSTEIHKFSEAKLISMSMQLEPFCHIDHDVFLFKQQKDYPSSDVVVQGIETGLLFYGVYRFGYQTLEKQNINIPRELKICAQNNDYSAYNCGYIDANNLELVQRWCKMGLDISKEYIPRRRSDNCVPEQYTLYALSKHHDYKVQCLFDDPVFNQEGPIAAGYVHLMESKKSHYDYVTKRLLDRCKEVAPQFYESLSAEDMEILKNNPGSDQSTKPRQRRYNLFSMQLSMPDFPIRNIYIK